MFHYEDNHISASRNAIEHTHDGKHIGFFFYRKNIEQKCITYVKTLSKRRHVYTSLYKETLAFVIRAFGRLAIWATRRGLVPPPPAQGKVPGLRAESVPV